MKIILPFLVLSAFLFSCGQSNLHTFKKPYPDFNYSGTRFIVYSKSKIKTHQDIEKAIGRNNGRILKKLKYNKGYVAYFKDNHIVNLDKNIRFELDIIHQSSLGSCSQEPAPPQEPNPDQPSQVLDWGIDRLNARKAWEISTGAGVTVCVVDTGIDTKHPDLIDNIKGGMGFVNGSDSYYDDADHGSHVSGIIAGVDNGIGIKGLAFNAKIWAVKVLDENGSGWGSDISQGILNCIGKADIINLSLGSDRPSSIIYDAIKEAYDKGLIIVGAAGNDAANVVGYPAAYVEVVAVSSSNYRDEFSYFSNFGPEIDFIAPGSSVLSTVPGGDYKKFSGTSMATPYVAAMYALALSAGKRDIKAVDIGLDVYKQGQGLPDAWETVK